MPMHPMHSRTWDAATINFILRTKETGQMKALLHYPGSKKRMAPWIVQQMPPHHSYLEPFFGSGAILFEKKPSRIETVNDIDGEVVNFFRTICDRKDELIRRAACTPYAREVYDQAYTDEPKDSVDRALQFAVKSMMGYGFRTNEKTGWKKDIYGREAAYAVRYWNGLPDFIISAATRLKQVQIECRPALELIKTFSHPNVLIYADPPYVLSTRGRKQYQHEMSDADHVELLEELCRSQAQVMISGYDCELYEQYLSGWHKEQAVARAQNNRRRVETLWMNF